MHLTRFDLLVIYLGGGFVVFLFWLALVGETLLGTRRRWLVRSGVGVLTLVGIVFPGAGYAAFDLVRLGQSTEEPALRYSAWWRRSTAVASVIGLAATVVLWAGAEVV